MKISKVNIQGFRAYKDLEDTNYNFICENGKIANLVAIYAPNGFGKSSFFDAIEWSITNTISRFTDDPVRSLNETVASETKVEGYPQFIIRNNLIEDSKNTFVNIETDLGEFKRTLPTTRKDSRDLKLGNRQSKTAENSEYKQIFLSQDGIDRFIREIKPDERYKEFMSHFGGEVEISRRNLKELKKENNLIIDKLSLRIKDSKIELDKSLSSIDNYPIEGKVNELKTLVPDIELDIKGEHEKLLSTLLNKKESLEKEINLIYDKRKSLITLKENNEYISSTKAVINEKVSLKNNALQKITIISTRSHIENELTRTKYELENINKEISLLEQFKNKKTDMLERFNLAVEIKSKLIKDELQEKEILAKDEFLKRKRSDIDNEISSLEAKKLASEGTLNSLNNINLEINKLKRENLRADELIKKSTIDENIKNKLILDAQNQQIYYFNFKFESSEMPDDVANFSEVSDFEREELKGLEFKKNDLEREIKSLVNKNEEITSQLNNIEKIKEIARINIIDSQSSRCPVCNHDYIKHTALLDKVDTNIYSDAIKSNSLMIKAMSDDLFSITTEIGSVLANFDYKRKRSLARLEQTIINFKLDINTSKNNIIEESKRKSSNVDKLNNLLLKVENKDQSEVFDYFDTKVKSLANSIGLLINSKEDIKKESAELSNSLLKLRIEKEKSKAELQTIEDEKDYSEFTKFIVIKGISLNDNANSFELAISDYKKSSEEKNTKLKELNFKLNEIEGKLDRNEKANELITYRDDLLAEISNLEKNISLIEIRNEQLIQSLELNDEERKLDFESMFALLNNSYKYYSHIRTLVCEILDNAEYIRRFLKIPEIKNSILELKLALDKNISLSTTLDKEIDKLNGILTCQINDFFYTDLINSIYRRIDPHPNFTEVTFECTFNGSLPCLNVMVKDDSQKETFRVISPNLYFSAAQMNVLSLSIFLARAMNATDINNVDINTILIDDPIHSMDSINILAVIDLLRSISERMGKQIIISTHDENFYELLKRKMPSNYCNSKFLRLTSFGVSEIDYALNVSNI